MRKLSLIGGLVASALVALMPGAPGFAQQDSGPSDQPNLPPGDVLSQISLGSAGAGGQALCVLPAGHAAPSDFGDPTVTCTIEIEQDFTIYAYGPWTNQPVTLDLKRPDGQVTEVSAQTLSGPDGTVAYWNGVERVGAPLGSYSVAARQANQEVDGAFSIVAASSKIVRPQETALGATTARIDLAGFDPNSSVSLLRYVYLTSAADFPTPTFWFKDLLGPVHTDGRGEATYDLPINPADPPAEYGFQTDPPVVWHGPDSAKAILVVNAPSAAWDPPDRDDLLVQYLVTQADLQLAQVAGGAQPQATLSNLFQGQALNDATAAVQQLAAQGLSENAQLKSVTVSQVGRVPDPNRSAFGALQALVVEEWDRQLVDSSGNQVQTLPSEIHAAYLLTTDPNLSVPFWRITGSALLPQT